MHGLYSILLLAQNAFQRKLQDPLRPRIGQTQCVHADPGGTGTVAASMANKPSDLGSTFFLDVESNSWAGDVNQAIAMQKITKLNGTAVYIRTCESGTWTSWYKYTGTAM